MNIKKKKNGYVIIEGPIKMIDIDIDKEKEKIEREKKEGKKLWVHQHTRLTE